MAAEAGLNHGLVHYYFAGRRLDYCDCSPEALAAAIAAEVGGDPAPLAVPAVPPSAWHHCWVDLFIRHRAKNLSHNLRARLAAPDTLRGAASSVF